VTVFYDTHAHLDYKDYSGDLTDVIQRAHDSGVEKIITVGTDLESSARAIATAERFPGVYAAVGWHPNDAPDAPEDLRPALREMARHPKVVAVGETGLDYFRLSKQQSEAQKVQNIKTKQAEIFRQHMEVASETGLSCIVHERSSVEDVLTQMQPFAGKIRAVVHCFSENKEFLKRFLDMGCLVSFTGIITFKKSEAVCESLAAVPSDRFMLETDCPFLAPVPNRGKRCEPVHVLDTAKIAAEIRNCSLEELSAQTTATARKFFAKIN